MRVIHPVSVDVVIVLSQGNGNLGYVCYYLVVALDCKSFLFVDLFSVGEYIYVGAHCRGEQNDDENGEVHPITNGFGFFVEN